VKPPSGVIVTVMLTDWPALTVAVEGAITVKSQPVPLNDTVCGLPPALSVMVNVPVRAPTVVGANVTLIVHVPEAAKVAGLTGHVFV